MKKNLVSVCSRILAISIAISNFTACSSQTSVKSNVYYGEAQGFGGLVKAEVTFVNDKITDVVLTGDDETPSVGGVALVELCNQVKSCGNADIDGVTGATITSNAAKEAVQQAINDSAKEESSSTISGEVIYTPGTYESSQIGHHGELKVRATFSESNLENVEIISNNDTNFISDEAISLIAENAEKYQTVKLDSISGATLSSNAVIRAIEDCFRQAGANVSEMAEMPKKEKVYSEQKEYDVVVIGAGAAGITAALSLAETENGNQSDLSILLLEEMPFVGGSFIVSGVGVFNPYGTIDHENGKLDVIDEDTFIEYFNHRNNGDKEGWTNEALQRRIYQAIDPSQKILEQAGLPFTWEGITECEVMDMTFDNYSNNALADVLAFAPNYVSIEEEYIQEKGHASAADIIGPYLLDALMSRENITLSLNSEASKLLTDGNSVKGVQVVETDYRENTQTQYNVIAKSVILATGSPNLNEEILKKYDPEFMSAYPFSEAGQNGDGIVMMEEANLNPIIQGNGGMCYNGTSAQYAMEDGLALYTLGYPVINKDGKRYYDESITAPYDTGKYTRKQKDNTAYIIFDKNCEFLNGTIVGNNVATIGKEDQNLYDYMVRNGWAVKADTLEELAEKIGQDPEMFVSVIDQWNKAINGEIIDELMQAPELAYPVVEGPFYAEKIHAYSIESYVSVKTADGSTQLINESGERIDNLYGAGTFIVSNLFYGTYFNYGSGLTTSLASGYLAGKEVANSLK